jgi:hypothetical protein
VRLPRSTGAISGSLVVLLGLWGAVIAFVGPYFHYSFGSNTTWHYTTNRLLLDILPGALAVVAGGLLLTATTRRAGVLGGWLGLLAGAWFVIGPAVSLTWEHASGPIGRPLGGSTRQMVELVGYFYGLGALIIALVAFASGRFASRPALAVPDDSRAGGSAAQIAPVPEAETASSSSTPGYVSAPAHASRTGRFSLRRRPRGAVAGGRSRGSAGSSSDS